MMGASIGPLGSAPAMAQPSGLVAAYAFNEGTGTTTVDASGNGNTGSLSNTTWTAAGRFGGALLFNGTNARVTISNAPSLQLTTGMTLEAWVYPTATLTSWRSILGKTVDGYYLMASSDPNHRPAVGATWTAGNQNLAAPTALALNAWTHLAATFDGATVRLYVNGVQVASQVQTTPLAPTAGTLQIGGDSYPNEFFAGRIDEVRIYNRALSASELQTDLNTAVGGPAAPDTTAPTVAVSTPTSGTLFATNASPLTLGGTAADNVGVTQVFWANDRGGSGTATGTTTWSAAGIALQPGPNVLTVTAHDAAGNPGIATLTVTYDPTAPTVAFTTPTGAATYTTNASPLPLGGTAADNVGVTQVSWVNDRGGSGIATGTTTWAVAGIALQPGANVLTVTARDAAGNPASATLSVTYTAPDTAAPTVAVSTPTSGTLFTTNAGLLTLGGTAADNVGVAQVSWANDRGGSGTATGTTTWSAAGIALQPGANVLTVTAQDAAGNPGTATLTVTYDPTAPTVSVTAPTGGATVSGSVSVTATASDNLGVVGVQFLADGAPVGAEDPSAPYGITWDTAGVANGVHSLAARARDAAGNLTTTVPVSVTVANLQPTGLVAAYAFNEGTGTTVADISGNGHTGTISNAIWTATGRFGGALVFNGTNTRVTVPNAPSLQLTTGMTLEAWVYPTATLTSWRAIFAKTVDGYYLMASSDLNNRPAVGATWTAGNQNLAAPSTLALNTWTHMAATFDGATVRLYVNGAQVASQAQTTSLVPTSGTLQIGGDNYPNEFFVGRIDEVRIYNRALSASEIQTDLNTAVGGPPAPDTTAPTVAITAPTSGTTYSTNTSSLPLAGTAADDIGVTQVNWANDRGASGTATGTATWSATGIALQAGANVLTVTARDAAGNPGTATVTVTYDPTAPTVAVTAPTGEATYTTNTSPLTLGGSAIDNVGVTMVSWTNNRGGSGTATGTTNWSATGIGLQPGANALTITARDAAGNLATATLSVTYTAPDTTAPTVAVTTPTTGTTYAINTGYLTLGGTAADNVGVTSVTWANSRGGAGGASGTNTWTATGIPLQTGVNVLTITAQDAAGNPGTATLTVTYDPTAPTVSVTAPTGGATVSGSVSVTATASDNLGVVGVQFLADGAPVGAEDPSAPYGITWDTAGVANGVHSLAARARDAAGNLTTTVPVSVTVANLQPTGLVAAYAFNEGTGTTTADASGNGNTGALSNATWTAAGRFGGALVFNGTNARVTVPNTSSLRLTTGMTLEAWVYPTATLTSWRAILAKTVDGYYLMASSAPNNRPAIGATWTAGNQNLAAPSALALNTWTYLAATFDGATVRLYVNGTQVASQVQTSPLAPTSGTLQIGGDSYPNEFFSGRIDEVRIYNRALTAGEIQADMTIAVGGPPAPDTTPPTVAINSPVAGATVVGFVSISAMATDNLALESVQFFVDGAPLGDEVTDPPYAVTWDAAGISGTHTLTAVARDVAANTATSSPVNVTVTSPTPSLVGQWGTTFTWPIVPVNASLLPTGQVLAWDGQGAGGDARLWNPANNSFTAVPNARTNMFCSGQCALSDGRIFVAGGHAGGAHLGLRDANIFSPSTSAWTLVKAMTHARWYPTTTVLPDGRVLVTSGETNCDGCDVEIPEIYNPQSNTWAQLTEAPLLLPYYPHMFVLPDGRVLAASTAEDSIVTQVLNIATQTWSVVDSVPVDGGSAAMYLPGQIIKSGTSADPDMPTRPSEATTYVLDMTQPSPAWQETAPMAFPRTYHTLTLLPDGTVLALGGHPKPAIGRHLKTGHRE